MVIKLAIAMVFIIIGIVLINYLLRYRIKHFDFESLLAERVLPVNKKIVISKNDFIRIIISKFKGIKKGYLIVTKQGIYQLPKTYDEEMILEFCKSNNITLLEEEGFDSSREIIYKSTNYNHEQ